MKRFKCKKLFCVDKYDDDGLCIENETIVIEEGKIYELDKSGYMMIGGSDHVHLDAVDGSWLEITKEHLKEYFDEVEA
nr:hypothetical protein [uncultured Blautia sp.]